MQGPKPDGISALFLACVLLAGGSLVPATAAGRDNLLIGDLSVYWDYTERNYSETVLAGADAGEGAVVVPVQSRTGDRRDYTVSPRLTLSSRGQTDLVELTYAPGFVYDDLRYTTRVDQSFSLTAEKHFTRRWFASFNDTYFLGNDPARETGLRTAEPVASGNGQQQEQTSQEQIQEMQQVEDTGALDERVGSRRYWRNTADFLAEYSYGEDSLAGAGYTFEVLRNSGSETRGYTEYDRHRFNAHLAHRFNAAWHLDVRGDYSKGIFNEPAVVAVTPVEGEEGQEELAADVVRPGSALSSDLREYIGAISLDYAWSDHATVFVSDDSARTDYDDPLRLDNWTHNLALGLDYYFNPRSYATLSGGPSFSKLGDQSWEVDYNVYGSYTRIYRHSTLTAHISKSYDVQNFAGRGNGLTDTWEAGVDFTHSFTQNLSSVLFLSYRDDRRLQYPYTDTIVGVAGDVAEAAAAGDDLETLAEGFDYHEKLFQAGFSLDYTFLRWYTFSGGYTYAKDETGLVGGADYDEHRIFIRLAVSRDLFRW